MGPRMREWHPVLADMEAAMEARGDPARGRPIHCRVCTILIGDGYEERIPVVLPDGQGYLCAPCHQSLRRQAERRQAAERTEPEHARP